VVGVPALPWDEAESAFAAMPGDGEIMGSKKILLGSAAIVVVASAALLAPSLASGQMLVPAVAPVSLVEDRPGNGEGNGEGKAWGHHKDSPDFPGNNGRGHDKKDDAAADDAAEDAPGGNGEGKAWGHHKDSPDFPGNNGRGHDKKDD
jgi:hypothetical protein